jgi:hypothetical protein
MTNDYRALCADLLDELELWSSWHDATDLKDRAGAALDLAQPVTEGPSADDLRGIFYRFCASGDNGLSWIESEEFIQAARAVLARWGRPTPPLAAEWEPMPLPGDAEGLDEVFWAQPEPQPPADGEVAELVEWSRGQDGGLGRRAIHARIAELFQQQVVKIQDLEQQLETERMRVVACGIIATSDTPFSAAKNRDCHPDYWSASADDIARQIDELMRLRAQQKTVPMSERLPGPEDCDEQGRCWMFGNVEGDWRLISTINPGIPKLKYCFSHWLPANDIPTPSNGDD